MITRPLAAATVTARVHPRTRPFTSAPQPRQAVAQLQAAPHA